MEGLAELEAKYRVVALYQWLSMRMEELATRCGREVTFPDRERARELSQQLSTLLNKGLPGCVAKRKKEGKECGGGGGGKWANKRHAPHMDKEAMMGRLKHATELLKVGRSDRKASPHATPKLRRR
jgi:hypothetical protein